jgi:antitoxin (DNA-binding transcriptional repressor) of toxin-antitoxin stability system
MAKTKASKAAKRNGTYALKPAPTSGHIRIEAMEPPASIDFMGVKEVKGHMSAVVRHVAEEDSWVVVTWHGKPRAMLIPFSEEDLEDFILANHPEFVKRREEARREIEAGDYLTHEEMGKLVGD